mmetsp:Transcript_5861/g.11580  ORF Transcript_5861/g.11580 Transcript_5861/m.11580 type:complete len:275 (-) Transcript_5861:46-870(-)
MRHIARSGHHDAHPLAAGDGGQLCDLPLVAGSVEWRVIVEHTQRSGHAHQVLIMHAASQPLHEHLAMHQLGRQLQLGLEGENVLGHTVLGKAHGGGRQRRQPHRAAVRRLDPTAERLVLAQQILGIVETMLAQAALVSQPRVEAGAVRETVAVSRGDRPTLRSLVPRLVLLHLRQLLDETHLLWLPLSGLAISEVEGAVAELLRELALGTATGQPARPVVGSTLRPAQRLVGPGNACPLERVTASVRVVEKRLLFVAVANLLHRGGAWHAKQRV